MLSPRNWVLGILLTVACLVSGCGQASGTNLRTVEITPDMRAKWDAEEAARQAKRKAISEKKNEKVADASTNDSGGIGLRPGDVKRKEAIDKRAVRTKK